MAGRKKHSDEQREASKQRRREKDKLRKREFRSKLKRQMEDDVELQKKIKLLHNQYKNKRRSDPEKRKREIELQRQRRQQKRMDIDNIVNELSPQTPCLMNSAQPSTSQHITSDNEPKWTIWDRLWLLKSVKFFQSFTNMANLTLAKVAQNRTFPGFQKGEKSEWKGPFFFIQGSDTQFGMISSYIEHNPVCEWEREIKQTREAIKAINAMNPKPKFFIICGDLVDAMPGTKYRNAQEEDFVQVFKELHSDIPLVCVCGNHDIGNTPSPTTVQNYRDKFGDDYFTFYCAGVMFIVLNSQFFEDPSLVQDLAKEQEMWLDQQLQEAKSGNYKHVIVIQHIPWFLREPNEEKEYFNILPELRLKMLQKFYDANVRAIFCGHYHRNAGGFYKDLELVVTSAVGCQLGTDKPGFRVVKLDETSIKHKYYTFEDAPKTIRFE